ncbi:MAG: trigger factor family protein, partial [Bdellovibrionales bacterium]|nr:trigger factor family protein [Bdellovibrionales bacterium]
MKIDLEKLGKLERKLNIEVPVEKVVEAFDRIYKRIQKTADIKGFRKGKAPLNIIKSAYKDRVSGDVIQDLVVKYYNEALDLHKLDPVNN